MAIKQASRARAAQVPRGRTIGVLEPQFFALGAGAILLATLIAYIPAIRAGYIWDDDSYVTKNATLTSFHGLWRIWFEMGAIPQYYPLVHTMYWIEYRLWGLAPLGYHIVNVLLHGSSAVALWMILARLGVRGAWLAAAIFALHPVHVESVAWITERKNTLSGLFYLLSAWCYFEMTGLGGDPAAGSRWKRLYALMLIFFVAALLSKTVVCTLPAALLVVAWWKRDRIEWNDVAPLIPMFMIGLPMGLLTAWIEKNYLGGKGVGAQGPDWDFTVAERVLIAGKALWFYAVKIVWPSPLIFFYPRWPIHDLTAWNYLYPLGALGLIAVFWLLRGRIGKGPLAAVLLFAGTLFPALGFFNTYPMLFSFVADHFQYLASIAPIVLLASGSAVLAAKAFGKASPASFRLVHSAICLFILLPLAILTWRRSSVYESETTLWEDTLAQNPGAFAAHVGLGNILKDRGKLDEAMAHFREAIRLKPRLETALNNIGLVLNMQGKGEQALPYFHQAIEFQPRYWDAHNNLGVVLLGLNRVNEAVTSLRRAAELDPKNSKTHNNLGIALARAGKTEEAIREFSRALELDPANADAKNNQDIMRKELEKRR